MHACMRPPSKRHTHYVATDFPIYLPIIIHGSDSRSLDLTSSATVVSEPCSHSREDISSTAGQYSVVCHAANGCSLVRLLNSLLYANEGPEPIHALTYTYCTNSGLRPPYLRAGG